MSDHGYDMHNEKIIEQMAEWAERVANKTLAKELDDIPDTVGFMACLQYAARKVKLRKDLLTAEMAVQIFRNLIDDLNIDNQAKA